MKKTLLILMTPVILLAQATDLRTLITRAKHNSLGQAKSLNERAAGMEAVSAEQAYAPTIDIGLSLSRTSPKTMQTPGEVGTAFVKAQMNLYDGGRKSATIAAKCYERQAAAYERQAFAKSTALEVIRHYFTYKKFRATLQALQQRSRELAAQLDRVRRLEEAGMTTRAVVDKLRAAGEGNRYAIENTRLAMESSLENLWLLSGAKPKSFRRNYLVEPHGVRFRPFEVIRAMHAKANAIGKNAEAILSAYSPQVNLSYTYSRSAFGDLAPGVPPGSMPDHRHAFQLSAGMRVYDGGKMGSQSESVRLRKLALLMQAKHETRKQRMNFRLAGKRLRAMRAQMRSGRSGVAAAKSTYATVKKQYEAGLVVNTTYLDALSDLTEAQARYQAARYDYEVAKAIYYFYAGADPKRYIR
jgi:outer membrane protein TolC